MRGDGCRYSHDGEAGSAPRRRPQHLAAAAVAVPAGTADKPIDQIKAEIAALQRFVAASTADKNKWCAYSCNNQFAVLENCHDNDNYPTEKPGGIGSPIQVSIYSRPETCESESVMPSQTPLVIVNQSGGGVLVDSTARCDSVEAGGPIACLGDTYHTKLPYSNPIVDSGATISMLGQDLMPHVVNRELLDRPIEVVTANDSIILTHQGDIPGDNPMKQAVINEASAKSLLSLRELCIRYDAGFEVGPGYINPKLVRDGVTVKDLIINNNLIEFPLNIEGIQNHDGCLTEPHHMAGLTVISQTEFIVNDAVLSLHNLIVDTDGPPTPCTVNVDICACMLSEGVLIDHYLNGHRPTDPNCPWCTQAGMRHRKAVRIAHSDRLNETGFSISVDLTGPHEPDIDCYTHALVSVEIASSKGGVYLRDGKTAGQ